LLSFDRKREIGRERGERGSSGGGAVANVKNVGSVRFDVDKKCPALLAMLPREGGQLSWKKVKREG